MKPNKPPESFRFFPPDILALLGIPLLAAGSITTWLLNWLFSLQGTNWVIAFSTSLGLAVAGATLLFFAKLPLYQERRYLTLGFRDLPHSSQRLYKWGLKLSLIGSGLAATFLAVSCFWR